MFVSDLHHVLNTCTLNSLMNWVLALHRVIQEGAQHMQFDLHRRFFCGWRMGGYSLCVLLCGAHPVIEHVGGVRHRYAPSLLTHGTALHVTLDHAHAEEM